jgi:thiol-disulfide isomerase/thioredoxin
MKQPIYYIDTIEQLQQIILSNKITIVKFGAPWCAPCKRVDPLIVQCSESLPDFVQLCILNVDVSFKVYSYFKSKRMTNGIPALLRFDRKQSLTPDDVVIGADPEQIKAFFGRI